MKKKKKETLKKKKKEKPRSQDKEQDERKTWSWLRFSSLWKMTQKTDNISQWPSLEGKGINRKQEYL